MILDTLKTELVVPELANKLSSLLLQSDMLKDALDVRKAPGLRVEGRRTVVKALGIPALNIDRECIIAGMPVAPSKGTRCSALDTPVLSEVCEILNLDKTPWPKIHTHSSRADRILAIIGALGCATLVSYHRSQILLGVVKLLVEISQQRQMTRRYQRYSRQHSGIIPGERPINVIADGIHLYLGDEVLACWALPDGEPSESVEEATVLAIDAASGRVLLQYLDGMELWVPYDWIIERKQAVYPIADQQVIQGTLPSNLCAFEMSQIDDGDNALKMLIQRASSPAEICHRIRTLCDRPRGTGLHPLTAAVRAALPRSSDIGQYRCIEALCALCNGGGQDAACARALANAILLSNPFSLRLSPSQIATLRRGNALSETQRSKLLALSTPASSWSRA